MEAELYYTTPSQEIFDEVKTKSIEVWKENYSDEFGYVKEKTESIINLNNIKDNVMSIVARFDNSNQYKLATKLSVESRKAIRDRMIDGGTPQQYIMF
jgi:hypothetical protein|tara:strand:- start:242 stop:535 length:294 start_codon:yes stop_codon:yes gene_type:complete